MRETDSRRSLHHTSEERPGFDSFEAWKEYEAVAMHFNELLMRLRSQSLAAVAAVAAVAGVVVRGDISVHVRWTTLAATCAVLALFWLAIWILDFTYYNRLLIGAVDALIEIESQTKHTNRVAELTLSTRIEAAVAGDRRPGGGRLQKNRGGWWFYGIVFATLVAGSVISVRAAGGIQAVLSSGGETTAHAPALQPQPTTPAK